MHLIFWQRYWTGVIDFGGRGHYLGNEDRGEVGVVISPLVLTENLFMDNQEDCAFLLSATGRQAIIDLHIDGIIAYLNEEEPKPFK